MKFIKLTKERVLKWWDGEFVRGDDFLVGGQRRPWIVHTTNRVVGFWLKYWQPIGAFFVVIGVIIAALQFYLQHLR